MRRKGLLAAFVALSFVIAMPLGAVGVATIMIADGSRSMESIMDGSGLTRMNSIQNFMRELIADEDPRDIGLIVFGQQFPNSNCRDVNIRVPLGQGSRDSLNEAIDRLRPYGGTPLAYAMRVAGQHLENVQGPKRIIVLTDGDDRCNQDPTAVQAELIAQGVEVFVMTFEEAELSLRGQVTSFQDHLQNRDLINWVNGDPLPLPTLNETGGRAAVAMEPPIRLSDANISLSEREFARRLTGTVDLIVLVDLTGQVQDVILVQSSGEPMLDDIAVASAWSWTFEAARQNGSRVAAEAQAAVVFSAGSEPQIIDGGA